MVRAGAPSAAQSIVFDETEVYPELGVLQAATRAGDWRTVSAFFDRFPVADEHCAGAFTVGEVPEAGAMLEAVIARDRQAVLPRVLLAGHFIEMGWQARTSLRAKHVSKEQFAVLHDHLRRAEHLLIDVTAREPGNALAWSLRQTTCLGLGLGQSEARRRYDRIASHHPHHTVAQRRLLQQLCPKWGGSWEAAYAFARECRQSAPPGGGGGIITADVHLECCMEATKAERAEYLRRPAVFQELVAAAHESVLHPAYRARFGWIGAHSVFAAVFSIAGDYPRAAVHFQALGSRASETPWNCLTGDPRAMFAEHRAKALAKG